MKIRMVLAMLLLSSSVIGQENLLINNEREKSTDTLFVLFDDSFKSESEVLNAINRGKSNDILIPELRDQDIERGYRFLPAVRESNARSPLSAREKLGRYLILETKNNAAAKRVARALSRRPDVLFAGVDSLVQLSSEGCAYSESVRLISESKTYGFSMIRAASAWYYAGGHSYLGIVDLGSDPNNDDLRPFNGNTYIKGNFHEHLAVDASTRVSLSGSGANPFSGSAFFGSIDEYLPQYHSSDPACDLNNNGLIEGKAAGHGTAVTGVIGASAENSIGMKGVCRHCPLTAARWNGYEVCDHGTESITQALHEADHDVFTWQSQAAAVGFMLDIGVQVINLSSGGYIYTDENEVKHELTGDYCGSNSGADFFWCLIIEYAGDVDVPIVAAAGNHNGDFRSRMHFPATDNRVWGIAGVDKTGARWAEGFNCGSNQGTSSYKPHFAAPAKDVFTTMYPDVNYAPGSCHEYNDGVHGDGFGYCTGTSLSAPHVAGIVGLLRSVNPLMATNILYNLMKDNSSQTTRTNGLGWGVPKTDLAVRDALGIVNMSQNLNRATPLFELYSSVAKDFVHTTKPQTAVAFARNTTWDYQSVSTTPSVRGFSYSESSSSINPVQVARAAAFILTTHRLPSGFPSAKPIYRMRYKGSQGGNPNNADAAIVVESEVSGFKSVGYNMEGMEGYIFSLCSPEPGCIPNGAEQFYRAYNANRDDHAVFLESSKASYQAAGYTLDLTKLGYAFRNQHSDADDLIDGFESMLGLNKFSTDSDCDGSADDSEFPLTLSPSSDPLQPNLCGGL